MAAETGLFGRALSGGALTALAYAASQALRLAANLVLARLLFPEAFGVMTLVTVALVGLQMVSDAGIAQAIARSPRGDAPELLDTAWTANVGRGGLLWLLSCALAWPLAQAYAAPELAGLLPVAGLSLLLAGFNPTRIDTANRHLLLGRLTALDLASQAIGIAVMIALAVATRSVWALALGTVAGAAAKLALTWAWLPGRRNRLRWDREAGRELLGFGRWIFLSSASGFLLAQGDKAVLGVRLTLSELGLYNIGWFLASFPILMAGAVTGRILLPLYRDHPPGSPQEDAPRLRRLRLGLSVAVLGLLALVALAGDPLVRLLYDDRYLTAGAIVTLVALAQMPAVIGMTYDQAALAAGDGSGYFRLLAAKAAVQTAALVAGAFWAGLGGAVLAQGLALALVHPLIIRLARRHRAWDPLHDAVAAAVALALVLATVVWRWPALAGLFPAA